MIRDLRHQTQKIEQLTKTRKKNRVLKVNNSPLELEKDVKRIVSLFSI